MSQARFTKCKHFRKHECEYRNDKLMTKLINLMENDEYDKYLANQVSELRCDYCEAFENKL